MDNQTARETLREMMTKYNEVKQQTFRQLLNLSLDELTAYMWGNGCRHITELADVLTRRKLNKSLGM